MVRREVGHDAFGLGRGETGECAGRREVEGAGEDREPAQGVAAGRLEPADAPRDGAPQRLLTCVAADLVGLQVERVLDEVEQVADRDRPGTAGDQLQGQGQPVDPAGDLGQHRAFGAAGGEHAAVGEPFGEEPYGVPDRKRAERQHPLANHRQRHPRGHHEPDTGAAREDGPGQLGRGSEHPLGLVDEHDHVAGLQGPDQARDAVIRGERHPGGDGQCRGQVLGVPRLVAGQRDMDDVVVGRQPRADVGEQPGLAHTTRPGDRDQPSTVGQRLEHARHLGLATDRG